MLIFYRKNNCGTKQGFSFYSTPHENTPVLYIVIIGKARVSLKPYQTDKTCQLYTHLLMMVCNSTTILINVKKIAGYYTFSF